ncbi:MAG: DNA primase [Patescibacteria group bacterium]|nr:DNA primase [Patescibacteria group bacterium]
MPDNQVEEIKQRLNISEVVSEYIKLTPAGVNYKAKCPFHDDKTPSFMVSDDKQIFHCFGCGQGGDIFTFVQEMEGVEFPEALKILAKKAGVQLRPLDPARQNKKTQQLEINKWAGAYFVKVLEDSKQAEAARDYLKKRGLEKETAEDFKLGFALDKWDDLHDFLRGRGYAEEDIFQAGLSIKKQKGTGHFDRFRARLMFPISDVHGNIIGFTGRLLEEKENEPKYMNTPQTLVYNKSYTLYGIDRAKMAIKENKLAVIVEGNMDVLASYQAGVKNVVASSGTALTAEQIKLLKRYTKDIAFCFDQDAAGQEATRRGLDQALGQDVNVKIIELPFGKDPDECIQKDPNLWQKAAKNPVSVMEYFFNLAEKNYDLSQVEDKKKASQLLLPLISKLFDPIEQSHYLQKLADLVHVDEEILREAINKVKEKPYKTREKGENSPKNPENQKKERYQMLSERIIGLSLKFSEYIPLITQELEEEAIFHDLRTLYKKLKIYYDEKQKFDYEDFIKRIKASNPDFLSKIDVIILSVEKDFAQVNDNDVIKNEIRNILEALKKNHICRNLKEVGHKIKTLEKEGKNCPDKLIQEFNLLTEKLKKIN